MKEKFRCRFYDPPHSDKEKWTVVEAYYANDAAEYFFEDNDDGGWPDSASVEVKDPGRHGDVQVFEVRRKVSYES